MTQLEDAIRIARSQIGYKEGYSGGHWNNIEKYAADVPGLAWANGYAWCDVFVNWVFVKAGLTFGKDCPQPSAACLTSVAGWRAMKHFDRVPKVGAQVFYGTGGGTHTGIVTEVLGGGVFKTVEGNTNTTGSPEGDGVYEKTRNLSDPYVYGFGHPAYATRPPKPKPVELNDQAKQKVLGVALGEAQKLGQTNRVAGIKTWLKRIAGRSK